MGLQAMLRKVRLVEQVLKCTSPRCEPLASFSQPWQLGKDNPLLCTRPTKNRRHFASALLRQSCVVVRSMNANLPCRQPSLSQPPPSACLGPLRQTPGNSWFLGWKPEGMHSGSNVVSWIRSSGSHRLALQSETWACWQTLGAKACSQLSVCLSVSFGS